MTYEMFSNSYNMGFRIGAGTQYALIKPTDNPTIVNGYITKGTKMIGDRFVPVGTSDKWLHVTSINGIACDGYVAQISNGVTYCEFSEIPVVDPGVKQEITSVLITPKYTDGTSGATEEYFPVLI